MDPSPIKKQKLIDPLQPDNSNRLVSLSSIPIICPQYQSFTSVAKGTFYPYNQKYNDYGWGCAWRAIQTLLSAYGKESQFGEFVSKYRRKDVLWGILEKQWGRQSKLKDLSWAPEQNQNCWAEPFIGKIICQGFNLKSSLKLVNGYPKAYAPELVFQETISFPKFWQLIKQCIPHSPVMIDDSQLALSIIGYKEGINNEKHLLLADPHITTNRSKENEMVGIYQVVLDSSGKQIRNDVPQDAKNLYPFGSYASIEFKEKKWMVLGVEGNQILDQSGI